MSSKHIPTIEGDLFSVADVDRLFSFCDREFDLTTEELLNKQTIEHMYVKQCIQYLLRKESRLSYTDIAKIFGYFGHANVTRNVEKFEKKLLKGDKKAHRIYSRMFMVLTNQRLHRIFRHMISKHKEYLMPQHNKAMFEMDQTLAKHGLRLALQKIPLR